MSAAHSPDERIARAGAATLAAGSARVAFASRHEGPTGPPARFGNDEGIADFHRRRAVTTSVADWASEDDDTRSVFDGARGFYGPAPDGEWVSFGAKRRDAPIGLYSPLWFLDALPAAGNVSRIGETDHRGDRVERFGFEVDEGVRAGALKRRSGDRLLLGRSRGRIRAEVWLDDQDRVRLLSAPRVPANLSGWVPREIREWLESLWGSRSTPLWTTTELWDFGTPAEIEVPPDEAIARLWRDLLRAWPRIRRSTSQRHVERLVLALALV